MKAATVLFLMVLLGKPAIAQDVDPETFYIGCIDYRLSGYNRFEIGFKKIVAGEFSSQIKAGYMNNNFGTMDAKVSSSGYSGGAYVNMKAQAFTLKIGYIPVKLLTARDNLFTIALNACGAFTGYNLDVVWKDAVYGNVKNSYGSFITCPGLEAEFGYNYVIASRFYLNLSLLGGVKQSYDVFTDIVTGNSFGNTVPGQGGSRNRFLYLNVSVGLGFDFYEIRQGF